MRRTFVFSESSNNMIYRKALALLLLAGAFGSSGFAPFASAQTKPEPTLKLGVMPDEVLNWSGWDYLSEKQSVSGQPSNGPVTRRPNRVFISSPKPPETVAFLNETVAWHEKIVVFCRISSVVKDPLGIAYPHQSVIQSSTLDETLRNIASLKDWVARDSNGKVDFIPDVTVVQDPIHAESTGLKFAEYYFASRLNGGGYEAEDKIFRGPYQGAIYVLPGVGSDSSEPVTFIHGTPISAVYRSAHEGPFSPVALGKRLHHCLFSQLKSRLASRFSRLSAGASAGWAEALDTSELRTDELLRRLVSPLEVSLAQWSPPENTLSALSPDTGVAIVSDLDKGSVVRVTETGIERTGGFAFPIPGEGDVIVKSGVSTTLTLELRSTSRDAIGFLISDGAGHSHSYSLGRTAESGVASEISDEIPFSYDGTWQKIGLDIRSLGDITGVFVVPTSSARAVGRTGTGLIQVDIASARFTSEPAVTPLSAPVANPKSGDPLDQSLYAVRASETSAELLSLISNRDETVRLNACLAYSRLKDEAAIPLLVHASSDLNAEVAGAAVQALAFQGGPDLTTNLNSILRGSLTFLARQNAARFLGESKDPARTLDLAYLLSDPSGQNRLAAMEALVNIPGKQAGTIRMAYITQDDPQMKVLITRAADPNDEEQMRKLLWSAVNEPSDVVRAESDIKLIQSKSEYLRKEGYKGVRDDSLFTRLLVLDFLQQNPSEFNRSALRLAVTDRSWRVRTSALKGFAVLDQNVSLDEVANILSDPNPEVQLALVALAVRKGLILPESTKNLMCASPDNRVKEAVRTLK